MIESKIIQEKKNLIDIARQIAAVEQDRISGKIKPVQASDLRGPLLITGLNSLARTYGFERKKNTDPSIDGNASGQSYVGIDTRGEIAFCVDQRAKEENDPSLLGDNGQWHFPQELADLMRKVSDAKPLKSASATDSWMFINHFVCEKLVVMRAMELEVELEPKPAFLFDKESYKQNDDSIQNLIKQGV
jgi:hypothetical protein